MEAKQTPLIDLLRGVPADTRMKYEVDRFHHRTIPVGRLCGEAAERIQKLEAENARLREALHRIDSIAVFLPAFEVLHEGGIEAVTQNIVEAIKATCTALESKK